MAPSASAKMGLVAAGVGACCLIGAPSAFVAPTATPALRASHNAAQLGPAAQAEAQGSEGQGSSWLASGAAGLLLSGVAARALSGRRAESSVTRNAIPIGINGFGRIGRQVARIAMKDPEV
eukprot:CAMPEP_0115096066 /NCGR_PEP_ID=MMETSP0227-20121206/29472_1 /TAXON_ID=89957 /ORGANISM="Polarella glacialis, Strain CCMP 1383" /LENGTH=120 /DNA_ID=CAMNT_0002489669 /DNA_START=50 /DNA_END=409 /DNA_ORIENTATION=+